MIELTLSCGAATDIGLVRDRNEDRYWVDAEHGAYLVIDGVGGQAAGERAAEIAAATIAEALGRNVSMPAEERVRDAIACANRAIFEEAQTNPERNGMACVLTLALIEGTQATVGHVGDSRLYLLNGASIRKLTSDHSPVGELEDSGEIAEQEAMEHPRRNEVFRDVGSSAREAQDADFIEIRNSEIAPESALLLCTDGLSDHLTSREIREIAEEYDGDATGIARQLVEAAVTAGGRDNVTAIFVAGPKFRARSSATGPRRGATRIRLGRRFWTGRTAFLSYGLLLGMVLWAVLHTRG